MKIKFEEGIPLHTSAVNKAHGPGMQTTLSSFAFASFIRMIPIKRMMYIVRKLNYIL